MIKKCPVCGLKFNTRQNGVIYCSTECKIKNRQKRDREKCSSKKQKSNLVELNAQAREMGLTYGKLQAMKYAQEHRLEV
ncbi:hypothetical protein [Anaerovorax sp. IOR16]|uniref:hypothetical protein n=1 Tax=Anaerovorax sp. IOR16 TaxID=2773458 RepID=UPI0019D2513A|nr:hypothetical protein [Anaerovorax sp. IOR16]